MFGDVGECVVFGLGGGCLGFSRLGGHPLRCRSAPSRPLALCEGEGPLCPSDISPTSGGKPSHSSTLGFLLSRE